MLKLTAHSFASVLLAVSAAVAQIDPAAVPPASPVPTADLASPTPAAVVPVDLPPDPAATSAVEAPAPIPPPLEELSPVDPLGSTPLDLPGATLPPATTSDVVVSNPNRQMNDFQGDDVATVLRLLARQAKMNLVVSDLVAQSQMTVTMRLENKPPKEVIDIIVRSKGLSIDEFDGVYFVKTAQEKQAEPTDPAFYIFSYANAEMVKELLKNQLGGGDVQVDPRTNAVFYRVAQSQKDAIALFLETIDRPTRQVMIEARLVEVTANPQQSYGINWGGVLGSGSGGQTFRAGGSLPAQLGSPTNGPLDSTQVNSDGSVTVGDFLGVAAGSNPLSGTIAALAGQFSILSAPQLSLTMRLLNEDSDAEFLANPRVVTADNQEATIRIVRNQPVPQLNFNEQTATAVFGGFEDKEFGNQLVVKPSINKDDFVTLSVKPEISNKVADATFTFAGATVASPVIDTRSLESNVLIKSGNTLAIGGLLQDEVLKGRTKVPVLGDIPILGYLFQEKLNTRSKRNLLVFVTPTIITEGYGTGLEDQVDGLHHSGEEYADPNGWRNNAKGAVRLVPTANRQVVADYPAPGTPLPPERVGVEYRSSTFSREK